jgi:CubicO group peptidase (beta-lactamase class C family)
VVREGEVIYAEGFGVRDLKKNLPATPDTLYGIGSCTKSFTAMAIMQLVEKGKIGLDDPVDRYVPLKIGSSSKPITIHHLLTHSSGIPNLSTSAIVIQRGLGEDTGIPWGGVDDFYRFVNAAGDEIVDEPGKRFFYCNAGYRMLGHIIQKISGVTFDSYLADNIFKPLDMMRTTLSRESYERDANRITPYWKKSDGSQTPTDFPYPYLSDNPDFSFTAAPGGIISSVTELTSYLTANMDEGRFGNKRLLSPESVERSQRVYMNSGRQSYGYGWFVNENVLGYKMVSHGGSILVSTAYLAFIPQLKIGIAMASNTSGFPYDVMAEGILAALLGKDPSEVVPTLQIEERMEKLAGVYETYERLSSVNVVNRGGLLYLEQRDIYTPDDSTVPLIPEDDKLESFKFSHTLRWTSNTR